MLDLAEDGGGEVQAPRAARSAALREDVIESQESFEMRVEVIKDLLGRLVDVTVHRRMISADLLA
jgi:hypothetical protein